MAAVKNLGGVDWEMRQSVDAILGLITLGVSYASVTLSTGRLTGLVSFLQLRWLSLGLYLGCVGAALLSAAFWYPDMRTFDQAPLRYLAIRGQVAFGMIVAVVVGAIFASQSVRGYATGGDDITGIVLATSYWALCLPVNVLFALQARQRMAESHAHIAPRQSAKSFSRLVRAGVMALGRDSYVALLGIFGFVFALTPETNEALALTLRALMLGAAVIFLLSAGSEASRLAFTWRRK